MRIFSQTGNLTEYSEYLYFHCVELVTANTSSLCACVCECRRTGRKWVQAPGPFSLAPLHLSLERIGSSVITTPKNEQPFPVIFQPRPHLCPLLPCLGMGFIWGGRKKL